jgi:hypothetical protein
MKKKAGILGRWPNETCKRCGRKNIYPEIDHRGRQYYRKRLICENCLKKDQEEARKPADKT